MKKEETFGWSLLVVMGLLLIVGSQPLGFVAVAIGGFLLYTAHHR